MADNNQLGGVKQNLDYNANYTLKDPDHDEIKDGYQLRWVGKDYAKLQENLRPETVIVPDSLHNAKEHNKDSQNLFLTGDNLEVLKHLEHAYTGQVDMIYIDPPYNTGSDGFVYSDNFRFTDQQLRDTLGLTETEVDRIKNIYGKASHSAWLTFMYPRLKLAKKLLKDTGVIFVSIDDNEQAQLKLLMDEIFNEGNTVAQLVWQKIHSTKNDAKYFSDNHEYIICYARGLQHTEINLLQRTEEMNARYQNPDEDNRGPWQSGDLVANEPRKNGNFDVVSPSGKTFNVPANKHWVYSQETMARLIEDNRIWFGKNDDAFPRKKRFLSEVMQGKRADTLLLSKAVGHNQEGKRETLDLFNGSAVFDTPKPVRLMQHIVGLATKKDSLVLDFFAGSATTAHAVMKLNKEDDGNRTYIMATLDEIVNPKSEAAKAGYKTIDEIARKRIDLAAESLGDTSGFRHYRFVKPDAQTLEQIEEFDPDAPKLVADDMLTPFSEKSLTGGADERGVSTILTTWLVDDGYSFDTAAQELDLAGYTAHYAPEIARLYLIEKDGWSKDACKALLNALGKNDIAVNAIVVYSYSFDFTSLTELKNNIKSNLDGKPQVIERY